MQAGPRTAGQPPPVKIYNAVYSSVQVYECMVRGIAVMRRRSDSYVNATQILKVAGVDKGRRTKILEKEILPGKHEIVQGGYGKYQGTWIPLERGRDIALQYGVAPLLSPLFDFTPMVNQNSLPNSIQNAGLASSPSPMQGGNHYTNLNNPGFGLGPSSLAPPPIMPGSALRLLNQGRAQGLFTPSTSSAAPGRGTPYQSPGGTYFPGAYPGSPFSGMHSVSPTPPPGQQPQKRPHSEMDQDVEMAGPPQSTSSGAIPTLAPSPEIVMRDASPRPPTPMEDQTGPSPYKRARTESPPNPEQSHYQAQRQPSQSAPSTINLHRPASRAQTITPHPPSNGFSRPASSLGSTVVNGRMALHPTRFSTKPSMPRSMDPSAPLKDAKRAAVVASICAADEPGPVLQLLHDIAPDNPALTFDVDIVLDDQGHTALHLAASMARIATVQALVGSSADIHRGNYNGETALMRATLSTHNADQQTFHNIVELLHESIFTLDTAKKSVIHHVVALAGVKGRSVIAHHYLDNIFMWIANREGGDFRSIVDLQDEHGDTALNISARVGSRSLVRTLLDVGANRILPNKLGLKPGDFGVDVDELGSGPKADDILSSLRSGPSIPVQKSQDVIADITSMVQGLSAEFSTEVKVKQDALDVTQAHLRAATRELSEQRRQIQHWQSRCTELDQINQRARNLEKAIVDEDRFDYTGRTDLTGRDARTTTGPAFQYRGQSSTMAGLGGSVNVSFNLDAGPTIPVSDSVPSLIRLRRLKLWHQRIESLLEERLGSLRGASAEKEFMCKKIVALCTAVPVDKVEDMLDDLLIAVESEAQIVDIGRVSGFMQKVRDGII